MPSPRTARVNELVQREISAILRRHYQHEAAAITILAAEITPDLRDGKVFVAVTGEAEDVREHLRWLEAHAKKIRHLLAQRLALKTVPLLSYVHDTATARGNRVLALLDAITPPAPPDAEKGGQAAVTRPSA
jgi:ribosome-binding factor A